MFGVACKERLLLSAVLNPHRRSPYFIEVMYIYSLFRSGSAAAFLCKSAFDGLVQGGSTRVRAVRGQGISGVYVMIPLIRRCSHDLPYLFVLSSCACLLTHCRCQCLPSLAGSQPALNVAAVSSAVSSGVSPLLHLLLKYLHFTVLMCLK